MLEIVYEFLGISGLTTPPADLAELIPYLLQFSVAIALVLATFGLIGCIVRLFMDGRWLR